MTVSVQKPNATIPIIDPQTGKLTPYGQQLLNLLVAAMQDHEARIVVLEP